MTFNAEKGAMTFSFMTFNFEKYVRSGRADQMARQAVDEAVSVAKAHGLRVEGYAARDPVADHVMSAGEQSTANGSNLAEPGSPAPKDC